MKKVLLSFYAGLALFSLEIMACEPITPAIKTTVCEIIADAGKYEEKEVSIDATVSGTIYFEVTLDDAACPNKLIHLVASDKSRLDESYINMVKRIYPGYPDSFENLDEKVPVEAIGKFFLEKHRGVVGGYLQLRSVKIIDP